MNNQQRNGLKVNYSLNMKCTNWGVASAHAKTQHGVRESQYLSISKISHFGPLLFSIYVNDLPSIVSSQVLLLADDVKLFCPIVNQQSNFQLEQDLLLLKEWSMKWLLNFNIVKTFVMHLGNTNPCHTYYMDGQPLQVVSEHKDLGIIVDSSLKLHSQATSAINKANCILGLIKNHLTL